MKKKIIKFLNKLLKKYWLQIISDDYRYFKYWTELNISNIELKSLLYDYTKNTLEDNLINYMKRDILISSTNKSYQINDSITKIIKQVEIYIKIK